MTKKDFIALADMIRDHNRYAATPENQFSQYHIDCLAAFLRSQNPAFNRDRWLDYIAGKCGPSGGSVRCKR
jgi:hypothetical protein